MPTVATLKELPEVWQLFDACEDLPLALLRRPNADVLSAAMAVEMQHRRPDKLFAEVPDRGHTPLLNEPAALVAIYRWIENVSAQQDLTLSS